MAGGCVPYGEGTVKLQVEDMRNITMEVENKNIVDNVIHAYMLQIYLKSGLKYLGRRGGNSDKKINATDT